MSQSVKPPIRVLYVARAPFISGAERALVSQLRHLDRDRVEPRVVLGTKTDLVKIINELGIPVDVVPLPKRSLKTMWKWWSCCRKLEKIFVGTAVRTGARDPRALGYHRGRRRMVGTIGL